MKLKTNLFIGKKPSLEEGQMIYTVSDEDTAINSHQRGRCCTICLQLLKMIFYVLLLLLLLCLVWFGFLFVTQALGQPVLRCPVVYDYIEGDGDFNSTEVDDMIKHAEEISSRVDYANIDPMDDSVPNQGAEEYMGYLDEAKTDDAKRLITVANEFAKAEREYINRLLQEQTGDAESTFPTTSERIEQ